MKNDFMLKFLESWTTRDSSVNPTEEIIRWIEERNQTIHVAIHKIPFPLNGYWYYDEQTGSICNRERTFFSVAGLRNIKGRQPYMEQPVIIQSEIGYLGIICREIDGVLHFLMQAKIEPGNINNVQISPTIQATKSNFTQAHGGATPAYLDYFIHAKEEQIVVDQIQSEQSSRFYKKRNRNLILWLEEEPEVLPSHKWMTLGQIKILMKLDNIVNMDTRTVLSCIPFSMWSESAEKLKAMRPLIQDDALFRSMVEKPEQNPLTAIFHYFNDLKMFSRPEEQIVPLKDLQQWQFTDREFRRCDDTGLFKVIYCKIEIEGREVRQWEQPLFEATGIATFGLITFLRGGKRMFVVSAREENGSFDQVELGPTVQQEAGCAPARSHVEQLFWEKLKTDPSRVLTDVLLSEEGGRFYHEQNRNVILDIPEEWIGHLSKPYFAIDYYTLNLLTQINNCLNIQLRNLISLLEV